MGGEDRDELEEQGRGDRVGRPAQQPGGAIPSNEKIEMGPGESPAFNRRDLRPAALKIILERL